MRTKYDVQVIAQGLIPIVALVLSITAIPLQAGLSKRIAELSTLEPINVPQPAYPHRATTEGVVTGQVQVAVEVNADGSVEDFLVTASTHPAFAYSTREAIEEWKFEPATNQEGRPLSHMLHLNFYFGANGLVVRRYLPEAEFKENHPFQYASASLDELDMPPTLLNAVQPTYPDSWVDEGIVGKTVIVFYIDQSGKVRVPRVEFAAHSLLGSIARDAVKKWTFEPPRVEGYPVFVKARQTFKFG